MKSNRNNSKRIIIAGGGLAGLSCGINLIKAGFSVELHESRDWLGGRASSWYEQKVEDTVESGIHSFIGFYDYLSELLEEAGVDLDTMVTWEQSIMVLDNHEFHSIGLNPIQAPGPLLKGAFFTNDFLPLTKKLALARVMTAGLVGYRNLDSITLAEFCRKQDLDEVTFNKVFRPLTRALFFVEPEEIMARAPFELLSHGILRFWNLSAGTFKGGMTDVMINPLHEYFESMGGRVLYSSAVEGIDFNERGVESFHFSGGNQVSGDGYVLATPLEVTQAILPKELSTFEYFSNIFQMESVPSIAVQLWFDHKLDLPDKIVAVPASPIVIWGDESYETFKGPVTRISAQLVDKNMRELPEEEYVKITIDELRKTAPTGTFDSAQVTKSVVEIHRSYRNSPGVNNLRPTQYTPIGNLFLAGDYTKQSWYITMEGAARSGQMAAEAIIGSERF